MRFILASNNKGKLREIKDIFSELGVDARVVSQREAGYDIDADSHVLGGRQETETSAKANEPTGLRRLTNVFRGSETEKIITKRH